MTRPLSRALRRDELIRLAEDLAGNNDSPAFQGIELGRSSLDSSLLIQKGVR